jgi:hypothetical protein
MIDWSLCWELSVCFFGVPIISAEVWGTIGVNIWKYQIKISSGFMLSVGISAVLVGEQIDL